MIINASGNSPFYPDAAAGHAPEPATLAANASEHRPVPLMDRIMHALDHAANAWVSASNFAAALPEPLQSDVKAFGKSFKSAAVVSAQTLIDGTVNTRLRRNGYRGTPFSVSGLFKQVDNLFQLTELAIQHGPLRYRLTPQGTFAHPQAPQGSQATTPAVSTAQTALKTSLRPAPGLPFASDNPSVRQAYARVKPRLQNLAQALGAVHDDANARITDQAPTPLATRAQYQSAFGNDLRIIGNNGETSRQKNNCFFIAAQQLGAMASGRTAHGTPDAHAIEAFRDQPQPGEEGPNEQVFSNGPLAKRFVDALNEGKPPNKQIRIKVIQVVAGHVLEEAYGADHPDAKESYMLDLGGHFEAIAVNPDPRA